MRFKGNYRIDRSSNNKCSKKMKSMINKRDREIDVFSIISRQSNALGIKSSTCKTEVIIDSSDIYLDMTPVFIDINSKEGK